jgi:hypothetical protein
MCVYIIYAVRMHGRGWGVWDGLSMVSRVLSHPGYHRVEKELSHPQLRNNPLQNAQD